MERTRRYTGLMGRLEGAVTIVFALYSLLFLGGIFDRLGLYIYSGSYDATIFAFILLFTFLKIPAYKGAPRDRLPWYDILLILLSLAGTLYIAVNASKIIAEQRGPNQVDVVMGLITVAMLLEAVRRAVSPVLSILGILAFIYPMFADKAPGFLERPPWGLDRITSVQYMYPTGIFGSTLHLVATVILAFLIFGSFLRASGAGAAFIDLAMALAGRYRGGPAKVAVLGSCLFGMINGSTLANIATVGSFTIPMMKSIGYKPTFAGAVEAVASNGGPLTPPVMGATIFLMMDFLGVSYVKLMAVAALPALLYYLGLMMMVDHRAVRDGLKGLPPEQIPPLKKALKNSWFFLLPFAVVLFLLIGLYFSPATAAIGATVTVVVASWFKKDSRMGPRKLADALAGSSQGLPEVGSAVAVAGILLGAFHITGLGLTIAKELVTLAGGNLSVLVLLTGFACFVLGMGLPTIAVYLLAAIFLAPALAMIGASPLAAHFFVIWVAQAALITPPVCNAAFVAGAMAGAPLMATGWQACRLGIVVYLLPFAWVHDPALLMVGSPGHIALATVTAIAGVYLLSCGISGWMLRSVSWPERILLMLGGALLVIPGGYLDLMGLVLVILPVLRQVRVARFVPARLMGR